MTFNFQFFFLDNETVWLSVGDSSIWTGLTGSPALERKKKKRTRNIVDKYDTDWADCYKILFRVNVIYIFLYHSLTYDVTEPGEARRIYGAAPLLLCKSVVQQEKNVSGEGVGKSLTRVMNWYANRLVHILGCGAKSTRGSECLCTHSVSNELYYGWVYVILGWCAPRDARA